MFCAFSPVSCRTDHVVSNNNFPENKRSQRRSKDFRKDVSFYVFVDTASGVELPVSVHEETHSKSSSSKRNEEDSESWEDPEGPGVADTDGSVEGALLGSQLVSQQEHDTEFQILKYLLQIDVFGFMNSAFSTIEILIER
ncbi:melanoma inhibitory activity protein 2-like, partial [Alexandromys fortis]|uniref:melanoma inhibitory activity protein 2-like n=1 Tax=Alexandromys fortis TaxID=100897 RepID=UPI002153A03E